MRQGQLDQPDHGGKTATLPHPAPGSRWRWATSRRAIIGGSIVAVALGLGSAGAGAAIQGSGTPRSGPHGQPPAGMGRPTTGGKVTALSGDTITIQTRDETAVTVTYSSSTTFRTQSGTSNAATLKVGDFIGVQGTKQSDGSVTATSIMFGTSPPGPMGPGGTHQGGRPPWGTGYPPGYPAG